MALLYTWLNKPNNYHLSSGWLFIKYVILLLLSINVMICILLIPIVLAYINDHADHDLEGVSILAASIYAVVFLAFAIGSHTLGFFSVKRQIHQLMLSYCLAASLILLSIVLSVKTLERPLITWLCLNFTTIMLTLAFSLVIRRMEHPAGPSIVNQADFDDVLYTR